MISQRKNSSRGLRDDLEVEIAPYNDEVSERLKGLNVKKSKRHQGLEWNV